MAKLTEIEDDEHDYFPDIAELLEQIRIKQSTEPTIEKAEGVKSRQSQLRGRVPNNILDDQLQSLVEEKIFHDVPSRNLLGKKKQNLHANRCPTSVSVSDPERRDTPVERNSVSDDNPRHRRQRIKSAPWGIQADSDSKPEMTEVSDFVVSDRSSSEEESTTEIGPARRTRRLVKGTRNKHSSHSEEEEADALMKRLSHLSVADTSSTISVVDKIPHEIKVISVADECLHLDDSLGMKVGSRPQLSGAEERIKFVNFPENLLIITPPGSPKSKPKKLASPKKMPRIPVTPHRPSMDAFWQQDVINQWNDEFSPAKKVVPKSKAIFSGKLKVQGKEPLKSTKPALEKQTLSHKAATKLFSERKQSLAESFLCELDDLITHGEISRLSASTGGVKIIWSKKLNTTAGRANWKRETVKPKNLLPDGSSAPVTYKHHAAIELAEKVIDDEDRLLNVLAHEFCHLANFMISNMRTNPHGKEFKAWASKCSKHFGHRGILVTTKHSYAIDYKYIWECEGCGIEVKRHSKSVDPGKHRCGGCMGRLMQTKPAPRVGQKVCEYQLFVRDNMKKLRQEYPESPQKDLMGLMGKRYQELKASRLAEKTALPVQGKVGLNDEASMGKDDEVEAITRKLNFFDLTSP